MPTSRDRLFYDRYSHCLKATVEYAGCLRELTGDEDKDIANVIRRLHIRHAWSTHFSTSSTLSDFPKAMNVHPPEKTKNTLVNLTSALSRSKSHRLVIGYHTVYIYSNDVDWLKQLSKMPLDNVKFTQAQVNTSKGSVLIKNSTHKHRTYFKQTLLTPQEKIFVANWLKNQSDIRMSPGLEKYCSNGHTRTYGNFFFDHSDLKLLQMLTLVRPNLVRETRNIVKEPLNN
jgi:hypothetical protein